ncbi:MAG: helix-turn-helix domain-containing protein [Clostridia bacterium]|nr:helix-turn-helix domain-containing protein [Clostridia bacterium]
MDYRHMLQRSLDEIEENLQADITAQELAEHAGFSLYHFYRLFHAYTSMPVMQYVQRRRLLHAIYDVRNGEKRIDAALRYGFDTYAGFYKAFRREYACTPSAFLRKNRAKKPVRINLLEEEHMNINQARQALAHWGMENEPVQSWYDESSGHLIDHALLVGEQYVLKWDAKLAGLVNSMGIAQQLKSLGVDTQTPVPTLQGAQYIQIGSMYVSLFRRARGKEIIAAELYDGGGEREARFVGEVIGQLHLALAGAEMQVKEAELLSTVRDWALPNAGDILGLSREWMADYVAECEKLFPKLPRQIIHRNPHPGAILKAQGEWGMIDFEMAERNVRIFDPCYAATAVLSESFEEGNAQKFERWLSIYHNILHGYDSVVRLTEPEKQAAPYVLLANQFVCVAWFATQEKYQDVFEINCKMTRAIISYMDQLRMA